MLDDVRIPAANRIGEEGHGFKFAPVLGRLVADLVLTDAEPLPEFAWASHV